MKTIILEIACWILPTNTLLKIVNNPNFTPREMGIIGSAMIRRFKTEEDLEQRCQKILG